MHLVRIMANSVDIAQPHLERIRTLTHAARGIWFTYLGVLAFVGITLLGLDDADFFALDRTVGLPLVGVAVPVVPFLFFGATIVAISYAYLHVTLEPLWAALGRAPARIGNEPLAEVTAPWLVIDAALLVRRRLGGEDPPPVEPGRLGTMGMVASFTLLFLAGPIIVWGLWLRSQTAHMAWLTGSVGLMALGCLMISWMSMASMRARLGSRSSGSHRIWGGSVLVVAVCLTLAVSLARTQWDPLGPTITRYPEVPTIFQRVTNWFRPAVASLSAERLTEMTPAWRPHDEAFRTFRRDWCADRSEPACLSQGLEDRDLNAAFDAARAREIAVMTKPDLSGRHMDHAKLFSAFLPGVTLDGARLRRVDMHAAQMEGVRAHSADMTGSVLIYARLNAADLRFAKLVGVTAYDLTAVNADLRAADLRGTDLAGADFRHALLRHADFSGANLDRTRFDGASAEQTRFAHADVRETVFEQANLYSADFSQARLHFAWLSEVGLYSAKFVDAIVDWTAITGRGDRSGRPDFTGAALLGVTFRNLDLSLASFDGPAQLEQTFADGSVQLPEGMQRPCHWSDDVLDDLAYYRHWRGVFDAMPYTPSWSGAVPESFLNVTPVPVPARCVIQPFDDQDWRAKERAFFERRQKWLDAISESFR